MGYKSLNIIQKKLCLSVDEHSFFCCLLKELTQKLSYATQLGAESVDGNHHETDEWEDERYVGGWYSEYGMHVDDGCLQRWQDTAATEVVTVSWILGSCLQR